MALAGGVEDRTVLRKRVPTPRGDYAATVETIAALVRDAECALAALKPTDPIVTGLGHPGSAGPDGRWRNANSTWLNGRRLHVDVESALGRRVTLSNDANCLALSEARDGAAAGLSTVFAVIIGTGCGGGLVVNGKVHDGASGLAGEWGHVPLPWMTPSEYPGPLCWCGQRGCLETFLSGVGFATWSAHILNAPLDAPAIARRAADGDIAATGCIDLYVDRLARALAMIVNIVDPEAIVLGGGMSNLEALYAKLPTAIGAHVFGGAGCSTIVQAKHGDSSGVRGAAWLARDTAMSTNTSA